MEFSEAADKLKRCLNEVKKAVDHPPEVLRAVLVPIIGGGHGLLEGEIGVAKTTTVKAISQVLELDHKRIDCTPDLFPSDVVGGIELKGGTPGFVPGPALLAHILQIEEINRASPKAQAGSISIMEERQIDIRGKTHHCKEPFIVFATQNPIESTGVFPLPEALLDRFMVRIKVPYPKRDVQRMIIEQYKTADHTAHKVTELKQILNWKDELKPIRDLVDNVIIGGYVNWICDFCEATRENSQIAARYGWSEYVTRGAGPRALRDIAQTARALAVIQGESHVKGEFLEEAVYPVLRHRITLSRTGRAKYGRDVDRFLSYMLSKMPPRLSQ